MEKLKPVTWLEFVSRMKELGFEGPFYVGCKIVEAIIENGQLKQVSQKLPSGKIHVSYYL